MDTAMNILNNTVPISLFNKGLAGRIFNSVKETGAKVVMKNNAPECILLSPEEYKKMIDEINDAKLLEIAINRLKEDDGNHILADKVYEKAGISEKDLESE